MAKRKKSDKKKTYVVLGIIVLVLVIGSLMGGYFWGKHNGAVKEREICADQTEWLRGENSRLERNLNNCIVKLNTSIDKQAELDACIGNLTRCQDELSTPDTYTNLHLTLNKHEIEIILIVLLFVIPISIVLSLIKITLDRKAVWEIVLVMILLAAVFILIYVIFGG